MKQQHHLLVMERKTARESQLFQREKEGEEMERERGGGDKEGERGKTQR